MNRFYKGYDDITASSAFKSRMVRTLQNETKEEAPRAALRLPIKRRTLAILIAAAAALLAIGTAAAATIIAKNYYSPAIYMMNDKEAREQKQDTVPDIENAIASAEPKSGDFSVIMLPEMKNADELNEWRQKMGQPVYSEEDWGWIREIRPEIQEVLVDSSSLSFNVRLNTDHGMSFDFDRSSDGQHLDAACDAVIISFEKNGQKYEQLIYAGTGIHAESVSEDGATLGSECNLDDLSESLPTEGRAHATITIGVRDAKVDDMADIGLLANITYSFDFDASAGADVAAPKVSKRVLSGSVVLTLFDTNGREYNKRVSLDGVTLEETVSYRNTGVYVTYRVESAPEDWTQDYINALLRPCPDSGSLPGFFVTCAPKGSMDVNEVIIPGKPSSNPLGEHTCILPFFPSDYERIKAEGYEIRIGYRCVDSFNGKTVGEDWHFELPDGVSEWDFTTSLQPIASFDLKLP